MLVSSQSETQDQGTITQLTKLFELNNSDMTDYLANNQFHYTTKVMPHELSF